MNKKLLSKAFLILGISSILLIPLISLKIVDIKYDLSYKNNLEKNILDCMNTGIDYKSPTFTSPTFRDKEGNEAGGGTFGGETYVIYPSREQCETALQAGYEAGKQVKGTYRDGLYESFHDLWYIWIIPLIFFALFLKFGKFKFKITN